MLRLFTTVCTIVFFTISAAAQLTAKEWFNKGVSLNDLSDYTTAVKAFEKAVMLDAQYAEAYYRLGWTHNELGAYDKAIENLKKAVELKKDYAFALQEMGYAYKKKENYSDALNYFNKAIIAKPDYATAYKQLGDVYIKLKRGAEGATAYEKAYNLDNKNEGACYELGFWYNENNNFEKSLEWLNRAAAIKPAVSTYNEIGFAKYKLLKNDESIAAYKSALLISPVNGTAYKGMGDVYRINYKPAKTTEAIENYKKAIQYNAKSSGSYYGLGWCCNELGKYDSSIIVLNKSIELDRTFTAAYTELGYAQYMKGYNNDALVTFDKVIIIDANITLPRYYKGFVYIAQNDKSNAAKMYNELKPLDTVLADKLLAKINAMK
jgi:tetratricopeptide (TPR) repeat protein